LGAMYSNSDYISKIEEKIPVWNVNCIASYILELISNNHFKKRLQISIDRVKKDTNQLYINLNKIPYLKAYKPTGNFVMAKIVNGMIAKELRDNLLQERIFIRDCTNKVGLGQKYVRIASRTQKENFDIARHIEIIMADFESKL